MRQNSWLRFWKINSRAAACAAISFLLTLIPPANGSNRQEDLHPQGDIGLEIRLLNESRPLTRFAGPRGFCCSTVVPRRLLRISDPNIAGEFTAMQVQAEPEGDGLRVRVFIVYHDISSQKGSQDKKPELAGSYLIRSDESIRTSELAQFGIEPVEIKAMDARPVVLQPWEGARIRNSATLEVEKLERHFDYYSVWLKNKSSKNIVAYSISTAANSTQSQRGAYGTNGIVLAAGAISNELHLSDPQIEVDGVPVLLVVFEDGTFEGDAKLAVQYLAKAEGVRIQSPSVLRRIEQTLKVEDSDLRAEFVKLEAGLWVIPEAMDKPTALQFLKTRFPDQDEKALSALYEVFKGGLYDGRNIALSSLGDTLRQVQDMEQRGQLASAVGSIRSTLERLRETFGSIISAPR